MLRGSLAGDDEDAAADDGADAQCGQSPWTERALQARAFAGIDVGKVGLLGEQALEIHREIFFFVRSGLVSPVLPGWPIIDEPGAKRPAARAGAFLRGDHS
jgi:hypothetical protein